MVEIDVKDGTRRPESLGIGARARHNETHGQRNATGHLFDRPVRDRALSVFLAELNTHTHTHTHTRKAPPLTGAGRPCPDGASAKSGTPAFRYAPCGLRRQRARATGCDERVGLMTLPVTRAQRH